MYLTIRQQAKLSKYEYDTLLELCRYAKNLFNEGLYNCRQYYFNESEYLNYEKNYHLLKTSENYKMLNSNMAQQILKEVDGSFKSFFGLLKLAKKGRYSYRDIRSFIKRLFLIKRYTCTEFSIDIMESDKDRIPLLIAYS